MSHYKWQSRDITQNNSSVNTKFSLDDRGVFQEVRQNTERAEPADLAAGLSLPRLEDSAASATPGSSADIETASEFIESITDPDTQAEDAGTGVLWRPERVPERQNDSATFARVLEREISEENANMSESSEISAADETNKQQARMIREDLDGYWESLLELADRIAGPKTDPAELVSAERDKAKQPIRERMADSWSFFKRKMVDSGTAVTDIGNAVGDNKLYAYYNMARASTNAAIAMIQDEQTDITGKRIGEGLNEIFKPIRSKGKAYYNKFQLYLLHRHNVDRMSRYSESAAESAREAFTDFKEANPELIVPRASGGDPQAKSVPL